MRTVALGLIIVVALAMLMSWHTHKVKERWRTRERWRRRRRTSRRRTGWVIVLTLVAILALIKAMGG